MESITSELLRADQGLIELLDCIKNNETWVKIELRRHQCNQIFRYDLQ